MQFSEKQLGLTVREYGCALFGLLGIPFALLSLMLLTWGVAWAHNNAERSNIHLQVAFGTIYFIGSMICFRKCYNPRVLLSFGIVLNTFGSYIWFPGFQHLQQDGWILVVPGVILTSLWILIVIRCFRYGL